MTAVQHSDDGIDRDVLPVPVKLGGRTLFVRRDHTNAQRRAFRVAAAAGGWEPLLLLGLFDDPADGRYVGQLLDQMPWRKALLIARHLITASDVLQPDTEDQ